MGETSTCRFKEWPKSTPLSPSTRRIDRRWSKPPAASDALSPVDQLDISHEADLASRLQDIPDIRADRVAAIRAEIEAGVYETDDKLDLAVSRLLDEMG